MKLKKRIMGAAAGLTLACFAMFSMAGMANASNESATIGLKMDPLNGTLSKSGFSPVNWQVETKISTADATILPLKEANLSLPDGSLTFNPDPKMPVCPDTEIGPPPANVSITVEEALAKCGDSLIGNGLATFALAQQTALPRDGVILAFNGGKVESGTLKGRPRVKVYAYSYDTGVGIYTEAALTANGSLDFKIPQLTADSSVTSINLNIPGKPEELYVASQDITVKLPAGKDNSYAQAKCATGTWNYGADFLLGQRDTLGNPTSPTTTLKEQGTEPCKGIAGKAKFGAVKVKGPAKAKRGKKVTYKVKIKNTGNGAATGVTVKVTGKGVSGKAKGGTIPAGKSKTVKVKVKFKKSGKVKAKFKATAARTGAKTATKAVKVK